MFYDHYSEQQANNLFVSLRLGQGLVSYCSVPKINFGNHSINLDFLFIAFLHISIKSSD